MNYELNKRIIDESSVTRQPHTTVSLNALCTKGRRNATDRYANIGGFSAQKPSKELKGMADILVQFCIIGLKLESPV
jgi:hypothetical protein